MKNRVTTEDRVQALKLARAFRGVVLPPRHLADEWTTREAPLPAHFVDLFKPLVDLAQTLADSRACGYQQGTNDAIEHVRRDWGENVIAEGMENNHHVGATVRAQNAAEAASEDGEDR